MDAKDPLADLIKEISDEEAALAAQQQEEAKSDDEPKPEVKESDTEEEAPEESEEDTTEEDTTEEEVKEPDADEEVLEAKETPKAGKERLIPVSERNKEAAARRKAEQALEAALEENARLKASVKPAVGEDGKPVVKTEEQIREEAKAEAKREAQIEALRDRFLEKGFDDYGKKEFDGACDMLMDMGAPGNTFMIAVGATGSPEAAAKAVWKLSQLDAEEIEEIVKMPPMRFGAELARLVDARPRRMKNAPEEKKPSVGKPAPKKVSSAAPPVKPINGARSMPEGFGDDVDDATFTERFRTQILARQ